jgi:predicted membrane protein
MGREFAFSLFFPVFMVSSIPGTVLGYLLLKALRKTKVMPSSSILQ